MAGGRYRKTQFPDDLNQRAQANIEKVVNELDARINVFASPTAFIAASGAIAAGTSIAAWIGSAGGKLALPSAASQGRNVSTFLIVENTTTSPVTLVPSGTDSLNAGTSIVLGAGLQALITSDGISKWIATGIVVTALLAGLVPAPGAATGRFFRDDLTWATAPAPTAPDVQTFLADGTWNRPAGGVWTRIELIPWGASGGSGARSGIVAGSSGGGGGAGSPPAFFEGPTSEFGATEAVTFGAQPLGGTSVTVDGTNGNPGTDAPDATFGAWLRATGGKKGAAGTVAGPTGGNGGTPGGAGNMGTAGVGGKGDANGAGTNVAGSSGTGRAAGGGGGGGSTTGTPTPSAGKAGGTGGGVDRATPLAGGTAGPIGTAGGAGTDAASGELCGGAGGGGGGGANGGPAGAGGNGGKYGGGGGGGGGGTQQNSGPGGNGGQCFCRVTTRFQ